LEREPWGPADNGAAARIPPVAVAYAFAPPEVLQAAVQEACAISHNDPMGQDGAWVAAAAIQWLLRRPRVQHHQEPSSSQQPASTISRSPSQHGSTEADELLAYLQSVARTSDMQEKLQLLRDNLFQVRLPCT
jgi:ADP-ribosylglycohydrolase